MIEEKIANTRALTERVRELRSLLKQASDAFDAAMAPGETQGPNSLLALAL